MTGLVAIIWYVVCGIFAVNVRILDIAMEREAGQSATLLVISKILTWPFWAFSNGRR